MSPARVLIYSATLRYRHESIPTAIAALQAHGADIGVVFDATEDAARFDDAGLAGYDAVLFLSTSGDVLDAERLGALQRYLDKGGSFVGVHSASCCMYESEFFGKVVGAFFDYHPPPCEADLDVVDKTHPSTSMLPSRWHVHDEMYNFRSDPRSIGATVVLSAVQDSYTDPGPRKFDHGSPHPTAWYQERCAGASSGGGTAGRSFYTSLGHAPEIWHDKLFLGHVLGGVKWAVESKTAKIIPADA